MVSVGSPERSLGPFSVTEEYAISSMEEGENSTFGLFVEAGVSQVVNGKSVADGVESMLDSYPLSFPFSNSITGVGKISVPDDVSVVVPMPSIVTRGVILGIATVPKVDSFCSVERVGSAGTSTSVSLLERGIR